MFKKKTYVYLVHDPCEIRSLGMCGQLIIGCYQVLNVWVILAQKHVSFISCIVQMFCMVYGCYGGI
jgi:hypothetical protein